MTMQQPSRTVAACRRQDLRGPLGLWLGSGCLSLATGLLPMHNALLGWSAPFWLLLTPLLLAFCIAPGLPAQWLDRHRGARHARHARIWN